MKKERYVKDSIPGAVNIIVLSLCGLFINVYLMKTSDGTSLGIFNTVYAFFIVMGQICVLGVHDSAQKFISENFGNEKSLKEYLNSSFFLSLGLGIFGALCAFLAITFIPSVYEAGGLFLIPGIALFVFNKVGLACLNGQLKMNKFYFLTALRGILLCLGTFGIVKLVPRSDAFGIMFTLTEAVLTLFVCFWSYSFEVIQKTSRLSEFCKEQILFGLKAMPHNLFTEAFIRIDILVMVFLTTNRQLGQYSFVAFIFEGLLQVAMVFRTILNPRLSNILSQFPRAEDLINLLKQASLMSGISTSFASLIAVILFPHVIETFSLSVTPKAHFNLTVLLVGLSLSSFVIPFEHYFIQKGRPEIQSYQLGFATLFSIVLNFILIKNFGSLGAAFATATAFIFAGLTNSSLVYLDLRSLQTKKPAPVFKSNL